MFERVQEAVVALRMVGKMRWPLYIDLVCIAWIGISLRPALASVVPLLTSTLRHMRGTNSDV
jgi:cyanate permease